MTAPAGRGIFGDAVTTLISLAGVPGFLTAAYLIEAWGRKPACVAALVGAAVSAWFYGTAANEARIFAWGLALQFCQFGMWSVLYAYTPELYPTRARATGAGFASAIGRLGSLLGPFAVGVMLPLAGQAGVFARRRRLPARGVYRVAARHRDSWQDAGDDFSLRVHLRLRHGGA